MPNLIVKNSPGDLIDNSRHLPEIHFPTINDAIPKQIATETATIPLLYATPPHTTNVDAENMVIYEDTPDNHQDELRPAMNMSSELLILFDTTILTTIKPIK